MKKHIILYLTIIGVAMLSPINAQSFSQQRLIQMSCITGSTNYWPTEAQHNEMCAIRQLKQFMPIAPEGWQQKDINWVIKISKNDRGFKETKEVHAISSAFKLYPFVKYTTKDNRGAIYILGTLTHEKVAKLEKEFNTHIKKDKNIKVHNINDNISYYTDPDIRVSPYMSRARYKQTHVKINNMAYLVFYFEEVVEDDFIDFIINFVDYKGIQDYLNQMTQQSSHKTKTYEQNNE